MPQATQEMEEQVAGTGSVTPQITDDEVRSFVEELKGQPDSVQRDVLEAYRNDPDGFREAIADAKSAKPENPMEAFVEKLPSFESVGNMEVTSPVSELESLVPISNAPQPTNADYESILQTLEKYAPDIREAIESAYKGDTDKMNADIEAARKEDPEHWERVFIENLPIEDEPVDAGTDTGTEAPAGEPTQANDADRGSVNFDDISSEDRGRLGVIFDHDEDKMREGYDRVYSEYNGDSEKISDTLEYAATWSDPTREKAGKEQISREDMLDNKIQYDKAKVSYEEASDKYNFNNFFVISSKLEYNLTAYRTGLPGANGKVVSGAAVAMDFRRLMSTNLIESVIEVGLHAIFDKLFPAKVDEESKDVAKEGNEEGAKSVDQTDHLSDPVDGKSEPKSGVEQNGFSREPIDADAAKAARVDNPEAGRYSGFDMTREGRTPQFRGAPVDGERVWGTEKLASIRGIDKDGNSRFVDIPKMRLVESDGNRYLVDPFGRETPIEITNEKAAAGVLKGGFPELDVSSGRNADVFRSAAENRGVSVEALKSDFSDRAKSDYIESRISNMEKHIPYLEKTADGLRTEIGALQMKLDGYDRRIESLDAKIEAAKSKGELADQLEADRNETVEARSYVKADLDGKEKQLGDIESTIKNYGETKAVKDSGDTDIDAKLSRVAQTDRDAVGRGIGQPETIPDSARDKIADVDRTIANEADARGVETAQGSEGATGKEDIPPTDGATGKEEVPADPSSKVGQDTPPESSEAGVGKEDIPESSDTGTDKEESEPLRETTVEPTEPSDSATAKEQTPSTETQVDGKPSSVDIPTAEHLTRVEAPATEAGQGQPTTTPEGDGADKTGVGADDPVREPFSTEDRTQETEVPERSDLESHIPSDSREAATSYEERLDAAIQNYIDAFGDIAKDFINDPSDLERLETEIGDTSSALDAMEDVTGERDAAMEDRLQDMIDARDAHGGMTDLQDIQQDGASVEEKEAALEKAHDLAEQLGFTDEAIQEIEAPLEVSDMPEATAAEQMQDPSAAAAQEEIPAVEENPVSSETSGVPAANDDAAFVAAAEEDAVPEITVDEIKQAIGQEISGDSDSTFSFKEDFYEPNQDNISPDDLMDAFTDMITDTLTSSDMDDSAMDMLDQLFDVFNDAFESDPDAMSGLLDRLTDAGFSDDIESALSHKMESFVENGLTAKLDEMESKLEAIDATAEMIGVIADHLGRDDISDAIADFRLELGDVHGAFEDLESRLSDLFSEAVAPETPADLEVPQEIPQDFEYVPNDGNAGQAELPVEEPIPDEVEIPEAVIPEDNPLPQDFENFDSVPEETPFSEVIIDPIVSDLPAVATDPIPNDTEANSGAEEATDGGMSMEDALAELGY